MDHSSARDLFEAALEQPAHDRAAFLERTCSDPGLRQRVDELLRAHEQAATSFLRQSAIELTASDAVRAGRRLGAYELVRELGRGGMGVVFLAVRADDAYRKEVAIKLIHSPLANDELVNRFRRER